MTLFAFHLSLNNAGDRESSSYKISIVARSDSGWGNRMVNIAFEFFDCVLNIVSAFWRDNILHCLI